MIQKLTVTVILLTTLVGVSGCASVQFYTQSVLGHSRLMLARIPLEQAIEQSALPERELLRQVPLILDFAETEIGLPVNNSYQTYVPLDRDFPVYVVTAAPEFALQAKQWCYLVIGCASYRGYFSEQRAQQFARDLQEQEHLDVYVRGAAAYSTLGWFADPVLPSMLAYGEVYLAELLLHELTHQKLYIAGDTDFNEALASAVAELAMARWLESKIVLSNNSPEAAAALLDYQTAVLRRADFDDLINQHKARLEALYATQDGQALKHLDNDIAIQHKQRLRSAKQQLHAELLERYAQLKREHWNGDARYDGWFAEPVNNARLAAMSSYRDQVLEFKQLFAACEQDFERFFSVLDRIDTPSEGLKLRVPTHCQKAI